jgi:hypothetical protein
MGMRFICCLTHYFHRRNRTVFCNEPQIFVSAATSGHKLSSQPPPFTAAAGSGLCAFRLALRGGLVCQVLVLYGNLLQQKPGVVPDTPNEGGVPLAENSQPLTSLPSSLIRRAYIFNCRVSQPFLVSVKRLLSSDLKSAYLACKLNCLLTIQVATRSISLPNFELDDSASKL